MKTWSYRSLRPEGWRSCCLFCQPHISGRLPVERGFGANVDVRGQEGAWVGDIVTVVIAENNGSSRNNNTTTSRTSGIDASVNTFLYSPGASGFLTKNGKMPAMSMTGKNTFAGGGQIADQETITAQLAVKVIDVLPNGNLVVEGRRQTAFAGEKQEAVLRGTVRADDVTATNTVFSYNIADASIQYISRGALTDSQRKGWFTTVWDKVSPF